MKELTIIAKNDLGSLAEVAEALGGVGVNIEAISAYGQDDNAIFRVITHDVSSARKSLSRIAGLRLLESDAIVIQMNNRPGELGKITRKLAKNGINLESLYILSKKQDHTEVALKTLDSDFEKAKEVLGLK